MHVATRADSTARVRTSNLVVVGRDGLPRPLTRRLEGIVVSGRLITDVSDDRRAA